MKVKFQQQLEQNTNVSVLELSDRFHLINK